MPSRRQAPSLDCPGGAEAPLNCNTPLIQRRLWTGVASTSARRRVSGRVGCGHAARVNLGFRASLEAQLLMVARRLSHRVVAIGLCPPSSDSWHPTHSTHKFTRAPAWGESHLDQLVSYVEPLGGPPLVEEWLRPRRCVCCLSITLMLSRMLRST